MVIIIIISSCDSSKRDNSIGVKFVSFDNENKSIDENYCSLFTSYYKNNFRFDYTCNDNQLKEFDLVSPDIEKCELSLIMKDTINLECLMSKFFNINATNYQVHKFVKGLKIIDGLEIIFFNKELGLLIKYNNSWGTGIKLSNHSESQITKKLVDAVLNDEEFFHGLPKPSKLSEDEISDFY